MSGQRTNAQREVLSADGHVSGAWMLVESEARMSSRKAHGAAAPRSSQAIALHVLVSTTDPVFRREVRDRLTEAVPVIVHVVDDLADCVATMHEQQFDVVLADAVTPGFDDPMLLRMARDTQPMAVRVALLGADPVARSQPANTLAMVAHFAVGRDDLDDLGERVRRLASLQQATESPTVRAQIAQCQVLPSAPGLYTELSSVLSLPDAPLRLVAELVGRDPEITARVLQLTNSAFTGRRRPTSDLTDAVAYVGVSSVSGLVLSMEVLRSFRRHGSPMVLRLVEEVARHGQRVARTSMMIAPTSREAYTAGLLHDIGKLVLAANDEVSWAELEACLAAGERSLDVEARLFGVGHDAVGASLLANWGLPIELIDAVAHHHRPDILGDGDSLAGAVHIADSLSHDDDAARLDLHWLQRTGRLGELDRWRRESAEILV